MEWIKGNCKVLIEIIYGIFFVLALFSAVMVVLSPNAVYSALYLVMTMVSIGGLFVMMNAQLAAAFQIIVYAGAIMVLFLFVIMLLNLRQPAEPLKPRRWLRWAGLLFGGALAFQLIALVVRFGHGMIIPGNTFESVTIDNVARTLLTEYIYAFEMTSVLLLIAVIGAVVLARRQLVQGGEREGRR